MCGTVWRIWQVISGSGLKFVFPTLSIHFVQGWLGELWSGYFYLKHPPHLDTFISMGPLCSRCSIKPLHLHKKPRLIAQPSDTGTHWSDDTITDICHRTAAVCLNHTHHKNHTTISIIIKRPIIIFWYKINNLALWSYNNYVCSLKANNCKVQSYCFYDGEWSWLLSIFQVGKYFTKYVIK